MKKLVASLALTLAVFALPITALAAEFRAADSQNGTADVSQGETVKNLYIAGSTVNVSGDSKGDLTAAGNALNLTGPIEDNLLAAGSNLNLSGKVGKNVHIAGSNVSFSNSIGGDLFVAGGTVDLSKEASVAGDLYAAGSTLNLNGSVSGRARIVGGTIAINGKIDGDLNVDAKKLIIGDNAVISGKLTYRAPQAATISQSAVIKGATDFQKTVQKANNKKYTIGMFGVFGFIGIIMSLALLFALVYLLPRTSRDLVGKTLSTFWANLGWGFLTFVVAPTALVILATTFLGLKIAAVLALVYLVFIVISYVFSGLAIGAQILKWIEKTDYRVDWLTILVGALAVAILSAIPILGGLVIFAFSLAVLGQLLTHSGAFIKDQRRRLT